MLCGTKDGRRLNECGVCTEITLTVNKDVHKNFTTPKSISVYTIIRYNVLPKLPKAFMQQLQSNIISIKQRKCCSHFKVFLLNPLMNLFSLSCEHINKYCY